MTFARKPPPPRDDMLLIGKITVPFGVRGQVRMFAITSYPEHLRRIKTVYVGDTYTPYPLERSAVHKGAEMIVTLGGVTTRDAAEALRGQEVFMPANEALPLEADEYFLHDLPGLRVRTVDGTEIGTVREVLDNPANEVLVVTRADGGDVLVPMIKDVVQQLDLANGEIVINPLPGLLE